MFEKPQQPWAIQMALDSLMPDTLIKKAFVSCAYLWLIIFK